MEPLSQRIGNVLLNYEHGVPIIVDDTIREWLKLVRELEAERSRWEQRIKELDEAAQAVVDRWETPLWKDVPHTAEYIHRLRDALSAAKAKTQEEQHEKAE